MTVKPMTLEEMQRGVVVAVCQILLEDAGNGEGCNAKELPSWAEPALVEETCKMLASVGTTLSGKEIEDLVNEYLVT